MFSKKHWTFSKIPRDVFLKNNGMFFLTPFILILICTTYIFHGTEPVKTVFKQCFNSVLMPFKHGVIITEKLRFLIVFLSFPSLSKLLKALKC